MHVTTYIAGATTGAAAVLATRECWRRCVHGDRTAPWRASFALLVAVVAVTGAAAVTAEPAALRPVAAQFRGSVVLLGMPSLLHALGLVGRVRPPRWLVSAAVVVAVVGVPVIFATDVYVTGALTEGRVPELGGGFRLLSLPPVVMTAGWSLHVLRQPLPRLERIVLLLGIGGPTIASALLLTAPSGRDALWVVALSPLLVATETGQWRIMRLERDRQSRLEQQQRRLVRDVRRANEDLRVAVRASSDILDATSHELRTPLTAVLGFTQVLLDRGDQMQAGERDMFLSRLQSNGERLRRLVEDLLAAQPLVANHDVPAPEGVDVAVATHDLVRMLGLSDDDVIVDVPSCTVVDADPTHVRRILLVLLENAMAHGCAPRRVSTVVDGDDVVVHVEDAGSGVPVSLRERLFDPFVQASTGDQRRTGGLGLGLHNAAHLASRNLGHLAHVPRDSGGSVFELRLPRQLVEIVPTGVTVHD